MKRSWTFLIFFSALILFINSCQKPSNDLPVTLSIDPPTPTPNSTVTIVVDTSLNMGVTLASIAIDGVITQVGNGVPLRYEWRPMESKNYIVEGRVENIFGQKGFYQQIVNVLDRTAPSIKSIKVIPTFPERNSPTYLSLEVDEPESRVLKTTVTVGTQSRTVQTIDQPIVIELPRLPEGEFPLSIVVSSSDFAKASTSTVLTVYPIDTDEPSIELNLAKNVFSTKENVLLYLKVQDDTEVQAITVDVNGTQKFSRSFSKTKVVELPLNLGQFERGLHSVAVFAKDGRGKMSVGGAVFAVGVGTVDVKLKVSNNNPLPSELVKLEAVTSEVNVKRVVFSVDGMKVYEGLAFTYHWRAVSGKHILAVTIETEDGRVGVDAIQIEVQDLMPPKITSFSIGGVQLKTDRFEAIPPGYYGVRISIRDDTAVKQSGTILVIVSTNPFPNISPVAQFILVQEKVSEDLKEADYVGAVSLTNGRFYLIPTGVSDIYENSLQNLQFLLEVK